MRQWQPNNVEMEKNSINNSWSDIQVGGGIHNLNTIEQYVNAGAYRIILGTITHIEPEFVASACEEFPDKIIVGIDARDGNVAIKGWVEVSDQLATDLAKNLESYGVSGYIFTDISRDGMLQGPNLKSIKEFSESTSLPVIASGGVGKLKDIEDLLALEPNGVEGIIPGKAPYDKNFPYAQTLAWTYRHAG